MVPDAIVSCTFLLLGSGYCVYRLLNRPADGETTVLPEFVIASIGIVAVGARSFHALFYNTLWRSYPIDPVAIAKELREAKDDKNYVDWALSKIGIASLVCSFYCHHGFAKTGILIFITLAALEILKIIEEIPFGGSEENGHASQTETTRGAGLVKNLPFPPSVFWIISTELLGRSVGNPFCRIANVPYAMSEWAFPREGFYTGWWITHSINDYTMLAYLIVTTEALCLNSQTNQ